MDIRLNSVEVIIVTRGRMDLLGRSIQSALAQTYAGRIRVRVIIDDCRETLAFLQAGYASIDRVFWTYYSRSAEDKSGPSLLARLRTKALLEANADFICFLDDDNEYYPFHIEKLAAFLTSNPCDAAFSYLELFNRDGSKFLEPRFPWARERQQEVYWEKVADGIMTPGSNIKRDKYRVSIDTNAWMIRKASLGPSFCIDDCFDCCDWGNNLAEDDKMMLWFMASDKKVLPSGDVSVKYYLGGYSNVYDGSVAGTVLWDSSPI
jgi:glycosyltransferase involved in cell wall biosynthesis